MIVIILLPTNKGARSFKSKTKLLFTGRSSSGQTTNTTGRGKKEKKKKGRERRRWLVVHRTYIPVHKSFSTNKKPNPHHDFVQRTHKLAKGQRSLRATYRVVRTCRGCRERLAGQSNQIYADFVYRGGTSAMYYCYYAIGWHPYCAFDLISTPTAPFPPI